MSRLRKSVVAGIILLVVIVSVLVYAIKPSDAVAEVVEEPIYVSFFWVGVSENDCIFKDTLITHSTGSCEREYGRVENMIKNLSQEKKLNWGPIMKCGIFKTHDEYNAAVNKYTDKCVGAEPA